MEECAHNKAVVARLPELLANPDPDLVAELFTNDFKLHDVKYPNWPSGHEGARRMFVQMKALVPDMTVAMEDIFGEDDRVCVRWRFKGTLTGSFEGREGDGSRLEMIMISIYRLRDGRIAEDWGADIRLRSGHPWRTD